MADAVRHGKHGLTPAQEDCLNNCVSAFGDTWFTVSMYCLAFSAQTEDCLKNLAHMHACGCVRKPVNDGGQEYYQVMPGIVYPKQQRR